MKVRQRLLSKESVVCELRYSMPGGETRYLRKAFSEASLSGSFNGEYLVICQDVTETRLAQNKLFQVQKMDAIGNLTGGIAHDFNNLLAVVLGNLELLDEKISDTDQKTLIHASIRSVLSGSELTRNMLSFAQRAPLAPTLIDLNNLTRHLSTWIGRTLPSQIEVETSLLAGLWVTELDASSAESVLLNLILNAREAMPAGGKLTIETCNVRIDEDYLGQLDENIPPGRYVLLAVSDTGIGIPRENLEQIFEPFYSTKKADVGSGLGLPMLMGFMKQSGGLVRVYSEVGVGTTIKLYFVAAKDQAIKKSPKLPSAVKSPGEASARILLVENHPDVLAVFYQILVAAGYDVITSISGDDAFSQFDQMPTIDLLLTDIVMPGELLGTTLAKKIRIKRPGLPVVYMSGYAKEATVHGSGLQPHDIRLMKPIGREDLLHALEKALAAK
ncbi:ATP-binding protein [Granulosicoccus sp. 3-233]|uniref:ATP-binding protein n=1 Tax=Granulosicoccus sp. 3-233 TaxID=3417969 RepID=UPI003D35108B